MTNREPVSPYKLEVCGVEVGAEEVEQLEKRLREQEDKVIEM